MMVPHRPAARNVELAQVTISASYVRVPDAARVETLTRLDDLVARGAVPPPSHTLGGRTLIAWALTEPVTDDPRERARWLRAQCHLAGVLGVAPSVVPLEVPAFVASGSAVPLDTLLSGATSLPGEHVVDLSPTPTPPGPTSPYSVWFRAVVLGLGLAPGKRGAFRRATPKDRAKARALDPAGLGGRLDATDLPRLAWGESRAWTCPLNHDATLSNQRKLGRVVDCEVCAMTWAERGQTLREPLPAPECVDLQGHDRADERFSERSPSEEPSPFRVFGDTERKRRRARDRARRKRARAEALAARCPDGLVEAMARVRAQSAEVSRLFELLASLPARRAALEARHKELVAEQREARGSGDPSWVDEVETNLEKVCREYAALETEDALRAQINAAFPPSDLAAAVIHRIPEWTRYLPDDILIRGEAADARLVALLSGLGSGKTAALRRLVDATRTRALQALIDQSQARGERVLAITHRRSLADDTAERLGITSYRDLENVEISAVRDLVVSLHKLTRVALDERGQPIPYVVILDEVESVLRDLVRGTLGLKLAEVYETLRILLANASKIVLLDADLSDLSIRAIRGLLGRDPNVAAEDEVAIVNHHFTGERGIALFATEAEATARVIAGVRVGHLVAVPTTTDAYARRLTRTLAVVRIPDPDAPGGERPVRVWTITGEHSGDPAERERRRNIAANARNYDVVIYTPAITSGVSIDGDVFDEVVLVATGNHLGSVDLLQMIARVRTPRSPVIHAYVEDSRRSDLETDPAKIKEMWIRRCDFVDLAAAEVPFALAFDAARGQHVRRAYDETLLNLMCNVLAQHRQRSNNLREAFLALLERRRIPYGPAVPLPESDVKAARTALRDAKEEVEVSAALTIATAPDITPAQADDIERREATPSERAAAAKARVAEYYGRFADLELVREDRKGRRRLALDRLDRLLCHLAGLDAGVVFRDLDSRRAGVRVLETTATHDGRYVARTLAAFGLIGPPEGWADWRLVVSGGRYLAHTPHGWRDVTETIRQVCANGPTRMRSEVLGPEDRNADRSPRGVLTSTLERLGIHASIAETRAAKALKQPAPKVLIEGPRVDLDGREHRTIRLDPSMVARALRDVAAQHARSRRTLRAVPAFAPVAAAPAAPVTVAAPRAEV